jgi:hypothetical protein
LQIVPDTCVNVAAGENGQIPCHLKFGRRLLVCHSRTWIRAVKRNERGANRDY